MSNQSLRQDSIRGVTGTTGTLNEDWLALFDNAAIAAGTFNERWMLWLQARLTATTDNLPDLLQEFADAEGETNFDSIGTFTP